MQKQQFAIACLSALIFLTSSSLVAGEASCPRMSPLKAFNTELLAGTWWIYAVSPASAPDTNSRCEHYEYTYVTNNILTYNVFQNGSKTATDSGTLTQGLPGQFEVTLDGLKGAREYDILDIDYNNYFVAYYCKVLSEATVETRLIYTRTHNPSQSVINAALKNKGLSVKDLRLTDLKNCQ